MIRDSHIYPSRSRFNLASSSTGGRAYRLMVEKTFESLGLSNTFVRVTESGWRETQRRLDGSYRQLHGLDPDACALKAWLEHNINLREGAF
jgi:hypothetical protein